MSSQESFIKDFIAIRDGTIRPALENIGQRLSEQGHAFKIVEGATLCPPTPINPPFAGITLEVFPSDVDWKTIEGLKPLNKIPSITFGLNLSQRKVDVFVHPDCEGGKSILRVGPWITRSANLYALNNVTAEVVQQEVADFLKTIPLKVELK